MNDEVVHDVVTEIKTLEAVTELENKMRTAKAMHEASKKMAKAMMYEREGSAALELAAPMAKLAVAKATLQQAKEVLAQASQADKTACEAIVKEEYDSLAAVQSEYEAALNEAEVKSALAAVEAQNLVEKSLADCTAVELQIRQEFVTNPDLTNAQIDQLKKALPEAIIGSNPTK